MERRFRQIINCIFQQNEGNQHKNTPPSSSVVAAMLSPLRIITAQIVAAGGSRCSCSQGTTGLLSSWEWHIVYCEMYRETYRIVNQVSWNVSYRDQSVSFHPYVWVRLRICSQLYIVHNMGLCEFSLPISLVMTERIYTWSYYHHQIGSMNYYPLFRVRSWNNGMRCMSLYILIKQECDHNAGKHYKTLYIYYQESVCICA